MKAELAKLDQATGVLGFKVQGLGFNAVTVLYFMGPWGCEWVKALFEKVTIAIGLYIGYEGKCYMT